jgi:hypothetical protein
MSEPVTLQTFDKTIYTDSQDVTYDFADCISDGLPPRAMRYTMENKNNLSKRGSIYVGLGEKRETTISFKTDVDGEIQTAKYQSAKTGVLEPPTGEDGVYVLKLEKRGNNIKMAWVLESKTGTITDGIKVVNQASKKEEK